MDVATNALSALGFDIQVAIANLVNFAIVFFLLNKFLFPKIKKTIDERKRLIAEGIDNGRLAQTRLAQIDEDRQRVLKNAESEAQAIRVEAMKQKHQRLLEADDEAINMMSKSKQLLAVELDLQRKHDEVQFAKDSANAVALAVEKIIHQKFEDSEMSKNYITELIAKK